MLPRILQLVYPFALAVSTVTRYTCFSIGYLLFFFAYFVLRPIQRQLGLKPWFIKDRYFILSFIFSIIALLVQVIFQIFFATTNKDDETFVIKLFGLQRYENFLDGLQYLGPDLLMVAINLIVVVFLNKKRRNSRTRASHVLRPTLFRALQWTLVVFLLFAAIAFPAFASLPYFLAFAVYFFIMFFHQYSQSSSPDTSSHYWDLNLATTAAESHNVLDVGTNLPVLDSHGKVVDQSNYISPDLNQNASGGLPHTGTTAYQENPISRSQKYLMLSKYMPTQPTQTIHDVANVTRQRTQSTVGWEPSQIHDVGGAASTAVSPSEEVLQTLSQHPYVKTKLELWALRGLALYVAAHLMILYVVSISESWYISIPRELGLISPFGWAEKEWSLAFFVYLFHILSLIILFILTTLLMGLQAQFKTLIELIAYGQFTFGLGLVSSRLDEIEKVPQLNLNRQHYDRFIGDCLEFQFYQASLSHPALKERRRMEAREGNYDPTSRPAPAAAFHRVPSTLGNNSSQSTTSLGTNATAGNPTSGANANEFANAFAPNEIINSRFATHENLHQALNPRAQKNSNISSTLFAAWDAVRVEFLLFTLYVARMGCHVILLTCALFRPSIAGFISLILFTISCVLSSSYFKRLTPIICIFSFIYATCLYICTIPSLVSTFRAAVPLGLDAPSAPFFALLNAISPALVCGVIFRWCSLTAMDIAALEIRELKKDISFKTDQKIRVLYFIRALLMYLSDKVALLVLFFTALYMVNVIHAIFLITFIVFLSITKIARLLWPLLVYYSGIILLVLYAYGIIQPWANPKKTNAMMMSSQDQFSNSFETMSVSTAFAVHQLPDTIIQSLTTNSRTNSSLSQFSAEQFVPSDTEKLDHQFNLDYKFQPSLIRQRPGAITSMFNTLMSYIPTPDIKIDLKVPEFFLSADAVNSFLNTLFTSDQELSTDHRHYKSESTLLQTLDDKFDESITKAYKTSSRLLQNVWSKIAGDNIPLDQPLLSTQSLTSTPAGKYVMETLQTTGTSVVDIIGLFVPKDKLDWWRSLALYYCLFIVAAFQWNIYASVLTSNVNSMFEQASPAWSKIMNSCVMVLAYIGVLFCSLPYRPSIIKFISAMFVIVSFALHTFMRKPQNLLKVLWFTAVIYLAVVFVALYLFQFDKIQVWFTNLYPATRFTVEDLGFERAPKERFGVLQALSGPVFAFILSVVYLRFITAEIKLEKAGNHGPTVEEYYEILNQRGALLDKEDRHEREEQLWSEKNQRIQNMLSAVRDRQEVITQDVTRKRQASMVAWQAHQTQEGENNNNNNNAQFSANPLFTNMVIGGGHDHVLVPPPPTTPRNRLASVSAKNYQTLTRKGLQLNDSSGVPLRNAPPRPGSTLTTHKETPEEEEFATRAPYPPPNPPPTFGGDGDDENGDDQGSEDFRQTGSGIIDETDRLNDTSTSSQVSTPTALSLPPLGSKKKGNIGSLFLAAKNEQQQQADISQISLPPAQIIEESEEYHAPSPPQQPVQQQSPPQQPTQQHSPFLQQQQQQQQQHSPLLQQQQQQQHSPLQQRTLTPSSQQNVHESKPQQQSSPSMKPLQLPPTGFSTPIQQTNPNSQFTTPAQKAIQQQEIKDIFETDLPTDRTVAFWLLIFLPKYIYDMAYSIATLSHKQMYKVVFVFAWFLITEIQKTNILNFVLLLLVIGFLFFNKGQSAWAPIHIFSIILFMARYVFQIGQFNREDIKEELAYVGLSYWGTMVDGKLVFDQALFHTYGECILIALTCLQSIAYHHWRPKKVSPQEAQTREYEKWLHKKEKKLHREKTLEHDLARKKLEFYQDQLAMETLMQQSSTDNHLNGAVEQLIQAKLNSAIHNLQKIRGTSASDEEVDGPAINIAGNDPKLDQTLFELDAIPTYQSQFNVSPTLGANERVNSTLRINSTVSTTAVPRPNSSSIGKDDSETDSDDEEYDSFDASPSVHPVDPNASRRLPNTYGFTSTGSSRLNQMHRSSVLQVAQQAVDQNRPVTAAKAAGHQRPGSSSEYRGSTIATDYGGTSSSKKPSSARLPWCTIFFKVVWDLLSRLLTFVFGSFPIIGMQLTFFLMLSAAIYRANVMSIVDVFGIVGAYVMLGRKRVAVGWSIIIAILSVRVLWQYWMTMGIDSSPWWDYPWIHLQNHYQRWLILGHFPISEVHFEFFAILMACFQRKYWNILIRLNKNPLLALSDIEHAKDTADLTPEEAEKRRKYYQAYLHQQKQLRKLNLISSEDADPNAMLAYGLGDNNGSDGQNDGAFLLQDDFAMTDLEKHHKYIQLSRQRNDEIHVQQLAYVRYQHVDLENNTINPTIDLTPDPYVEVQVERSGFNRDVLLDEFQDQKIQLYVVNGFVPPPQPRKTAAPKTPTSEAYVALNSTAGLEDKVKQVWEKMHQDAEYQAYLQTIRENQYYNYFDTAKPSPFLRISAGFDYITITHSPQDDTSLLTQWDVDHTNEPSPIPTPHNAATTTGQQDDNLFMKAPLLSPTQRIRSSNRFTFSETLKRDSINLGANTPSSSSNDVVFHAPRHSATPASMMNSPTPNVPHSPLFTIDPVVTNDYVYSTITTQPSALTLGVQLDFTLSIADVSHLNQLNSSQYSIDSMQPYDSKSYTNELKSPVAAQQTNNSSGSPTFNPSKQIQQAAKSGLTPNSSGTGSGNKQKRTLWDENQQVSSIVRSVWPFLRFILMLVSDKAIFVVIFALCIARANLVRVGYLILTLGLIIDKSLYIGEITQTREFWTTLQRYNIFILSLITIYQCPFMPDFLSSSFLINGADISATDSISWVQVIGIQRYRDKDIFENGFGGAAALHYILIFLFIEIQRCLFVSEPYLDVIHFWEKSRAQSELKGRVAAQTRSDQRDLEIAMSKHTSMVLDEEFQGILNSVEQIEYAMSSKHHRQMASDNPNAAYAGSLHTPTPTPHPYLTPNNSTSITQLKLKGFSNKKKNQPLAAPPTVPDFNTSEQRHTPTTTSPRAIEQSNSPDIYQLTESHRSPLYPVAPLPPPPQPPTSPLLDATYTNSTTPSLDDQIISYNFFDDRLIWSDPTPSNWSTAVEEEQLQKQHHLHLEESKLLQLRHELELFNVEMEVRKEVLENYNVNQELLQSKESLIQDSATQQKLVKRIEDRKKKRASRRRERKCKNFVLRNFHSFKLLLLRGIDPVLLHTYGEYYGNIVEMPSKSAPEEKGLFHLLYLLCCTHSQIIVIFFMLLNSWINPSFLTLVAFAAFLIVGILQAPRASSSFVSFLFVYISVISIAQFTFQMPIFCVESLSRNYSLQPNPQCFTGTSAADGWNFDHLFGLYKAQDGTYLFLSWQLVVLIALAWHRTVLLNRGLWYKSEEDLGDPALQRSIRFHEKKAELDKELKKRDRFLKHYHDNIRRGADPTLITADLSDPKCSTHCLLKCLPQELKNSYFEVIPRSGRAVHSIKPGSDLYSIGFLLELIAALWIVVCYTQMATTSISGVTAAISSNFIQGDMVICLVVQTLFLVLDRIAYLKRSLLFKLVLHLAGIFYWGYSIFFQWPVGSMRGFTRNSYLQFFFFLKAMFYIISATQIQLGYPPQDSPVMQTLTKDVGLIRYLAFRIYRAVPFVYELRIILDWYCSQTSLDLWDTFKLDDIYCTLYVAQRLIWVRNKKKRGQSVDWVERFFTGIILFCGLLIVLFIPLLLFSSANPGSSANSVQSVEMAVRIETPKGSYPISTISSLTRMEQAPKSIYTLMRQRSMVDRADQEAAVQILSLSTESDAAWDISRGSMDRLKIDLFDNYKEDETQTLPSLIHLGVQLSFTRDNPPERPTLSIIEPVQLDYATLRKLLDILSGVSAEQSLDVPNAVPKYFRLPATTDPQVLGEKSDSIGIRLTLIKSGTELPYWRVEATSTIESLTLYTVSNPVWSVAFLAGLDYSIVAIYSVFVVAIGSFVRQVFAGNAARVIIEELPSVDRLLRFCQGIYIARAHGLLLQEEELFRKLVRIYRSPEKLVHLTARRVRQNGQSGELAVTKETNAMPPTHFTTVTTTANSNSFASKNNSPHSNLSQSSDILPQSGETTAAHRRKASVALKQEQDNISNQLHQQIQAMEYSRQQSKRRM